MDLPQDRIDIYFALESILSDASLPTH